MNTIFKTQLKNANIKFLYSFQSITCVYKSTLSFLTKLKILLFASSLFHPLSICTASGLRPSSIAFTSVYELSTPPDNPIMQSYFNFGFLIFLIKSSKSSFFFKLENVKNLSSLKKSLQKLLPAQIEYGLIDASFYRDDLEISGLKVTH